MTFLSDEHRLAQLVQALSADLLQVFRQFLGVLPDVDLRLVVVDGEPLRFRSIRSRVRCFVLFLVQLFQQHALGDAEPLAVASLTTD